LNTSTKPHDFQEDIDAIGRNKTIPILLETVLLATGMGFAAVARVTESRWVTCRAVDMISFGLTPGDELEVESTLCHEVRQIDTEIVIDDVHSDPVYVNHHTPARYGFRGYISVPIRRADGTFFGTLCAIDPEPRKLNEPRVLAMFRLFAHMIGETLVADEAHVEARKAVVHERELAVAQERFIAILAHDLRNPVAALTSGLRMLARRTEDGASAELIALMKASVARMNGLIENLLDQARKRAGGGLQIERRSCSTLDASLRQIVSELQVAAPDQTIRTAIDIAELVECDAPRICQLFSNLLGNAISHGLQGEEIDVAAHAEGGAFVLSVTNKCAMIPEETLPSLFLPFERKSAHPSREGLGLGLFIASEIAKGHDGALEVSSNTDRTVFTFRMPL
jgi:signal transduction histidine kinase